MARRMESTAASVEMAAEAPGVVVYIHIYLSISIYIYIYIYSICLVYIVYIISPGAVEKSIPGLLKKTRIHLLLFFGVMVLSPSYRFPTIGTSYHDSTTSVLDVETYFIHND